MSPEAGSKLILLIILLALSWTWFFRSTRCVGPWFLRDGRYMLWVDASGLHVRKGTRR